MDATPTSRIRPGPGTGRGGGVSQSIGGMLVVPARPLPDPGWGCPLEGGDDAPPALDLRGGVQISQDPLAQHVRGAPRYEGRRAPVAVGVTPEPVAQQPKPPFIAVRLAPRPVRKGAATTSPEARVHTGPGPWADKTAARRSLRRSQLSASTLTAHARPARSPKRRSAVQTTPRTLSAKAR